MRAFLPLMILLRFLLYLNLLYIILDFFLPYLSSHSAKPNIFILTNRVFAQRTVSPSEGSLYFISEMTSGARSGDSSVKIVDTDAGRDFLTGESRSSPKRERTYCNRFISSC